MQKSLVKYFLVFGLHNLAVAFGSANSHAGSTVKQTDIASVKNDVGSQNENIATKNCFVKFRSDASPNVGALTIDLFDENMNYPEEMAGNELKARLSNMSTNEVVVFLHQPPFALEWEEIRTSKNTYSMGLVSRNYGYRPRPINSLFFNSNSSWGGTR
jgi:hypothetical protein